MEDGIIKSIILKTNKDSDDNTSGNSSAPDIGGATIRSGMSSIELDLNSITLTAWLDATEHSTLTASRVDFYIDGVFDHSYNLYPSQYASQRHTYSGLQANTGYNVLAIWYLDDGTTMWYDFEAVNGTKLYTAYKLGDAHFNLKSDEIGDTFIKVRCTWEQDDNPNDDPLMLQKIELFIDGGSTPVKSFAWTSLTETANVTYTFEGLTKGKSYEITAKFTFYGGNGEYHTVSMDKTYTTGEVLPIPKESELLDVGYTDVTIGVKQQPTSLVDKFRVTIYDYNESTGAETYAFYSDFTNYDTYPFNQLKVYGLSSNKTYSYYVSTVKGSNFSQGWGYRGGIKTRGYLSTPILQTSDIINISETTATLRFYSPNQYLYVKYKPVIDNPDITGYSYDVRKHMFNTACSTTETLDGTERTNKLRNGYEDLSCRPNKYLRDVDIRVYFDSDITSADRQMYIDVVRNTISILNSYCTGITIRYVSSYTYDGSSSLEPSNWGEFNVFIGRSMYYGNVHHSFAGDEIYSGRFNYWRSNSTYEMTRAVCAIKTDQDFKPITSVVQEEIMQPFGLTNDHFEYYETLALQPSSISSVDEITSLDRQAMRLLYDSRINTRMTREEVTSVLSIENVKRIEGSGTHDIQINNLKPNTEYELSVWTANSDYSSCSEESTKIRFTTSSFGFNWTYAGKNVSTGNLVTGSRKQKDLGFYLSATEWTNFQNVVNDKRYSRGLPKLSFYSYNHGSWSFTRAVSESAFYYYHFNQMINAISELNPSVSLPEQKSSKDATLAEDMNKLIEAFNSA